MLSMKAHWHVWQSLAAAADATGGKTSETASAASSVAYALSENIQD